MNSAYLQHLPEAVKKILDAREERARVQRALLDSFACAVQICLNVPGADKRLPWDRARIGAVAKMLASDTPFYETHARDDGAGFVLTAGCLKGKGGRAPLQGVGRSPTALALKLKLTAVHIEESLPWGRLLDIDVITASGAVTRASAGILPRRCLVCPNDAKECARTRRHSNEELFAAVRGIWGIQEETFPKL